MSQLRRQNIVGSILSTVRSESSNPIDPRTAVSKTAVSKNAYDPETNPAWKGADRKTLERYLASATRFNNTSKIADMSERLKALDEFENSKKQYYQNDLDYVQAHQKNLAEMAQAQKSLKEKYGVDVTGYTPKTARQIFEERLVNEARTIAANGKGVPLPYDKEGRLTCIRGVCKIYSNAGVDFSSLKDVKGVVKDEDGVYVPQYNLTFAKDERYKKAGLEQVADDPRAGDIMMTDNTDNGVFDPYHSNLVLNNKQKDAIEVYNNFTQTNNPGKNTGIQKKYVDSKNNFGGNTVRYLRLSDGNVEKVVSNYPEYQKQSQLLSDPLYKKSTEYNKRINDEKAKYDATYNNLKQLKVLRTGGRLGKLLYF